MQRPPGAVQSLSLSQNRLQVLTVGAVFTQRRPAAQSGPVHTWPGPVLPVVPQTTPVESTVHCSPAAQPHCGTVSLHGLSAQAGPELVDDAALLVEVVELIEPDVASPPTPPVLLLGLPLVVGLPVVGLPVGLPPLPGPLESPPAPPVVEALAHAERNTSKLLKRRSDRGRMGHLANEKKRVREATPVTSKVNVLRDPS